VRGVDNLSTDKRENIAEILDRIDLREAQMVAAMKIRANVERTTSRKGFSDIRPSASPMAGTTNRPDPTDFIQK